MIDWIDFKPGRYHHCGPLLNWLTHWGRVTHICIGNLTIIVSDNGLAPDRRQAIIWTNAGILLIGPLGGNVTEISDRNSDIFIQANAFESIVCEMAAMLSWHQCVNQSHSTIPDVSIACKWKKGMTGPSVSPVIFKQLTHLPLVLHIRYCTGSALVQVMAWHRTGAKPLPKSMLDYG